MKTAELIGAALDWAVMKAEGPDSLAVNFYYDGDTPLCVDDQIDISEEWHPSTDWTQGGPIIEREMIELVPQTPALWDAMKRNQHIPSDGPTPLVAAMRCYVAAKLGDEIEIPEGLA
jgi:hypothetical protein